MTQRYLVIDWDYFFPVLQPPQEGWDLFDWGHSEHHHIYLEEIWPIRAADFLRRGLPLPGTSGEEETFWDQFEFAKGARLIVRDSNTFAYRQDLRPQHVWLYDAHHDSGYADDAMQAVIDSGQVSCEDWMLAYFLRGAKLHVRYPRWKLTAFDQEPQPAVEVDRAFYDPDEKQPGAFHEVYLCRSGAWVPSWLDQPFIEFIERCPLPEDRKAVDNTALPREFSWEHAETMAKAFQEQVEEIVQKQKEVGDAQAG
jgi:hypothetical protein